MDARAAGVRRRGGAAGDHRGVAEVGTGPAAPVVQR